MSGEGAAEIGVIDKAGLLADDLRAYGISQ